MRREIDAILSVQRYVAQQVFPQPWDVRLMDEAGEEPLRPYALIEFVASPAADPGTRVGTDVTIALAVNAYLQRAGSRLEAEIAALELRESMFAAVKWGPDARNLTPDRLPLWDFDETSIPAGQVIPYRNYCDYMRVASFGQQTIHDDADPRLAQVAVDLRLTFRRGVPVPSWRMAQRIVATAVPEG